jgi:predicted amidophosphoribosyltransferase
MNNRTITRLGQFIARAIEKVTDILLPKEEKVRLLETLGPDGLYENIPRAENFDIPTQINFDNTKIKAIFNYKTALCRQAIWEIKYRANKKLIRDFSLLLYDFMLEELDDLKTFHGFTNVVLLPIPASASRTREKGFNQCVLICRELIKIDQERNGHNFTLLENFLIKKNDTAHQARVSNRKARLKNLINTFSINTKPPNPLVRGKKSITSPPDKEGLGEVFDHSFIIIDDVITTGATMTEAFRALKTAGIPPRKIRGFSLAH